MSHQRHQRTPDEIARDLNTPAPAPGRASDLLRDADLLAQRGADQARQQQELVDNLNGTGSPITNVPRGI